MSDTAPARSPYLITAPSAHVRRYDMVVVVPTLRPGRGYQLRPWLRLVADCETDELTLAAGIKGRRKDDDDDGA